ncbi:MAG: RidA family protein, partial [Myxococcota bacterium]
PPLAAGARLLVGLHVLVPLAGAPVGAGQAERVEIETGTAGSAVALRRAVAGGARLDCAALFGAGDDALAQTRSAFERAEALLEAAGMTFGDVVRTWIHLRDIDRDYDALNAGRRAFFTSRGLASPPASTGIGGGPSAPDRALCLGFEAVRRPGTPRPLVLHAPTLNEAPEYGADFVRGLRVEAGNVSTLHVSGTASVDEAGRTAHPGDFDAQAERMLRNVRALLEGQGADFGDVVSAITYLKHRADADRLRAALAAAGFEGFPHALVEAPVCRPDLLCETEAIAHGAPRPS